MPICMAKQRKNALKTRKAKTATGITHGGSFFGSSDTAGSSSISCSKSHSSVECMEKFSARASYLSWSNFASLSLNAILLHK